MVRNTEEKVKFQATKISIFEIMWSNFEILSFSHCQIEGSTMFNQCLFPNYICRKSFAKKKTKKNKTKQKNKKQKKVLLFENPETTLQTNLSCYFKKLENKKTMNKAWPPQKIFWIWIKINPSAWRTFKNFWHKFNLISLSFRSSRNPSNIFRMEMAVVGHEWLTRTSQNFI